MRIGKPRCVRVLRYSSGIVETMEDMPVISTERGLKGRTKLLRQPPRLLVHTTLVR
jgi:hypothetical protein